MFYQMGRVPMIHVGTPEAVAISNAGGFETIEVCYHGFENLDATEGIRVSSQEFKCFGHRWRLNLYPGGAEGSRMEGGVSIELEHLSQERINFICGFNIKTKECRRRYETISSKIECRRRYIRVVDYCRRSDVMDDLLDGALVFQVRMELTEEGISNPMPFIAENPLSQAILRKFMDSESSDVLFEVSSGSETPAGQKRAKTSTTFHAHRFILQECTSTLGELCKSEGESSSIPITDVEPEIFRHMLYYIYGGKVSEENLKRNAKELIDAADKYGVVGLKLEAEARYVTSQPITVGNIIDNLLYSDAKNCALLKEAAMDFLVEMEDDAVQKLSFDHVPGHMMKDLLMTMNRGRKKFSGSSDANSGFMAMRVSALRKMLHEKGLDIDGSREAMIARLEANSSD